MNGLQYAVLHRGQQKIEVCYIDEANHTARHIVVTWKEKEPSDIPPHTWPETVFGEVEYQRGQDQQKSASFKRFMGQ